MTGLLATGNPARVLDVLETDGGWLTPEGIQLCLPHEVLPNTLKRALWNLRTRGYIHQRTIQLGRPDVGGFIESRSEWKVT